jgi:DNA repair protein RadC
MPLKELRKVPGIGHARACLIVASLELAKRYFKEQLGILPIISEPEHVLPLVSDLRKEKKEHLVGVYLNARNQMIHHETISIGTLNANIIHPREVFEPAVRVKAAGIILVHNHPSGDETPSEEDVAITQRLYESGRLLGIDLLDHLIITENALFSMTRQGILKGGRLDG